MYIEKIENHVNSIIEKTKKEFIKAFMEGVFNDPKISMYQWIWDDIFEQSEEIKDIKDYKECAQFLSEVEQPEIEMVYVFQEHTETFVKLIANMYQDVIFYRAESRIPELVKELNKELNITIEKGK